MPTLPARQRFHVPRLVALAVGAALLVTVAPATPAQADPTVAEVEALLDKQWEQLEPTIEQYNKVHAALGRNQQRSAELSKKIQPLSLQTALALGRIGDMAVRSYKAGQGRELTALLRNGSAATLVDQLEFLDRLAREERAAISHVTATRERYEAEQRKLDGIIAEQRRQDTELAQRRKAIETELARLEKLRLTAAGSAGPIGATRIGACPATYVGGRPGTAVRTACAQIGKPYVWGAGGPGAFDCSGLTQFAWGRAGVGLTHHTGHQWGQGRAVTRAEARPGDLVFFYGDLHHVGMYIGAGLMVHAPRAGRPVEMSRIDTMPVAGFRRVG